jgi:esterase/lipase
MRSETYTLQGGGTGIFMLPGFTGSRDSLLPWAEFLAEAGYTIHVPRLPGHRTHWREMNDTTWHNCHAAAERLMRGVSELLVALHSLSLLLREIKPRLAKIEMPILLIRSIQDHVVIVTRNYDAEIINRESLNSIKRLEKDSTIAAETTHD